MFRNISKFVKGVKAPTTLNTTMQLSKVSSCGIGHIKNMYDENIKYQVEVLNDLPMIQENSRVYKPTYTIEFDRNAEVLVYSCQPFKHSEIFFKYPYCMYESLIPASLFLWYMNPLELAWQWNYINLVIANIMWIPRVWYFRSLQYKVVNMHLLRGGRAVKIETHTLAGDRNYAWTENYQFHPLTQDEKRFDDRDEADFLEEEGQLKYELTTQLDNFQEFAVNQQDVLLYFMKQGTVHHPELFEAIVKGYNIDTSDFVINTAHNVRSREGSANF